MLRNNAPRRVAVFGTRWLGADVLERLHRAGFDTALVAVSREDRAAQLAAKLGIPCRVKPDSVALQLSDLPWRPDLIVCAHSFRILPGWFINRARLGAIGYHPSLLPEFKGRHAVADAVSSDARITGGTVYWLTEDVDAGPTVVAHGKRMQASVQILANETPPELWRRALAPLGGRLIEESVRGILGGS